MITDRYQIRPRPITRPLSSISGDLHLGPSPHASTEKEHESAAGLWRQCPAERSHA